MRVWGKWVQEVRSEVIERWWASSEGAGSTPVGFRAGNAWEAEREEVKRG